MTALRRWGLLLPGVLVLAAVVTVAGVALHAELASHHRAAHGRAPHQPSPASPGAVTVVGLGDSVVSGAHCGCSGVTAEYAAALGRRVHRHVRAVNLGVNGDTTATLQQRLDTDHATRTDLARADVVLVIEGANDLVPQLEQWLSVDCDATCYRPAVERMGARLGVALRTVRRLAPPRAQVVVAGYWNVFADGDAARASGGQALVDWSHEITRAANVAIQAAARPEDAAYVDLTAGIRADGTRDPTGMLADDGDHPNAAGVRAIVTDLLRVTRSPA